ncbi:aspartyl-phosphate phosphatase Spo0E family protein [Paenibacillus validus]|uniref:aspartyl-phosphate phosphatase Spo0E family protein n=1 Tax=Paenibacillus validus TaxID=44253 RepID=UPI003D27EC68
MNELLRELEKERRKLNSLGEELMKQSISLSCNQEFQEQSQKVDQLVARYHHMKAKRKQQVR